MKEMIENKGWLFHYSCMCGGSLRQHYLNKAFPNVEIRIRPLKQTFTIMNTGMQIAGPDWGYKLENKMKELELWNS